MTDDRPDPGFDDPEFPSGEWLGFYVESGSNHRQEMHLSFRDGGVRGAGADDVGRFVIRGGYDSDSKEVWWTKTYAGSHSVFYKGYRELQGIWGLWEIPPMATDGFRIWPRASGEGVAVHVHAECDEPVVVGAPS